MQASVVCHPAVTSGSLVSRTRIGCKCNCARGSIRREPKTHISTRTHRLSPCPRPRWVLSPRSVVLQHCQQLHRGLLGLVLLVENARVVVRPEVRVPVRKPPRHERVAARALPWLARFRRQACAQHVSVHLGLRLTGLLAGWPWDALGAREVHLRDLSCQSEVSDGAHVGEHLLRGGEHPELDVHLQTHPVDGHPPRQHALHVIELLLGLR